MLLQKIKRAIYIPTPYFLGGSSNVVLEVGCCLKCLSLLLLPDPFREMGAWRKTMECQKLGNSPEPGPKVVERQRVAKERAVQRVLSWTVQNEMKSVPVRVFAGPAGRILDSANPREPRT